MDVDEMPFYGPMDDDTKRIYRFMFTLCGHRESRDVVVFDLETGKRRGKYAANAATMLRFLADPSSPDKSKFPALLTLTVGSISAGIGIMGLQPLAYWTTMPMAHANGLLRWMQTGMTRGSDMRLDSLWRLFLGIVFAIDNMSSETYMVNELTMDFAGVLCRADDGHHTIRQLYQRPPCLKLARWRVPLPQERLTERYWTHMPTVAGLRLTGLPFALDEEPPLLASEPVPDKIEDPDCLLDEEAVDAFESARWGYIINHFA